MMKTSIVMNSANAMMPRIMSRLSFFAISANFSIT